MSERYIGDISSEQGLAESFSSVDSKNDFRESISNIGNQARNFYEDNKTSIKAAGALAIGASVFTVGVNTANAFSDEIDQISLNRLNNEDKYTIVLDQNSATEQEPTNPLVPDITIATSTPPPGSRYRLECSVESEQVDIADGSEVEFIARATDSEGNTWYITESGACIRADVAGDVENPDSLIFLDNLESLSERQRNILNFPVIDNEGNVLGTALNQNINVSELDQVVNHFINNTGFAEGIFNPEYVKLRATGDGFVIMTDVGLQIPTEQGTITYDAGTVFTFVRENRDRLEPAVVAFIPKNTPEDFINQIDPEYGDITDVEFESDERLAYINSDGKKYILDWREVTRGLLTNPNAIADNLMSQEEIKSLESSSEVDIEPVIEGLPFGKLDTNDEYIHLLLTENIIDYRVNDGLNRYDVYHVYLPEGNYDQHTVDINSETSITYFNLSPNTILGVATKHTESERCSQGYVHTTEDISDNRMQRIGQWQLENEFITSNTSYIILKSKSDTSQNWVNDFCPTITREDIQSRQDPNIAGVVFASGIVRR